MLDKQARTAIFFSEFQREKSEGGKACRGKQSYKRLSSKASKFCQDKKFSVYQCSQTGNRVCPSVVSIPVRRAEQLDVVLVLCWNDVGLKRSPTARQIHAEVPGILLELDSSGATVWDDNGARAVPEDNKVDLSLLEISGRLEAAFESGNVSTGLDQPPDPPPISRNARKDCTSTPKTDPRGTEGGQAGGELSATRHAESLRKLIRALLPQVRVRNDSDPERRCIFDLMLLEQHAHLLSQRMRKEVLGKALDWLLDLDLLWNRRFRVSLLIARLCALKAGYDYDWNNRFELAPLLRPRVSEGDDVEQLFGRNIHRLVPAILLFAPDDIVGRISSTTSSYLQRVEPEKCEHAVLTLCEGLRTCLVALDDHPASGSSWARRQVVHRIAQVMPWLRFEYFSKLKEPVPENELRLLFAYQCLQHSGKALARIDGKLLEIARIQTISAQVHERISDERIMTALNAMGEVLLEYPGVWHVEAACLHNVRDWKAGGRFARIAWGFEAYFKAALTARTRFYGPGWDAWRHIMSTFGTSCPESSIRRLAPLANRLDTVV